MPLNFPAQDPNLYNQGGSQGMFTDIVTNYKASKQRHELERAYKVLGGEADEDNRPFLEKALNKDYQPMTPDRAMSTLMRYDPKTYSAIQERQTEMEKQNKVMLDSFGKDAIRSIDDMKALPEEERLTKAPLVLQGLRDKYPKLADKINLDFDQDGVISDAELDKGRSYLTAYDVQEKPKEFTLSPGQKRFDAKGKEIASLPDDEKPLSNTGRVVSDFKKGLITKEQMVESLSKKGMAMSVDPTTGEIIMTEGGPGALTAAQRGKAADTFTNKVISGEKFVVLSNEIMDSVANNAAQIGVTGAIARLGDEIKSAAQNLVSLGVDTSEISNELKDYDFGSLASESAEFKTNALTLALIFASATGLGEGRSLTNQDVQRSLDSIGASTNSPEQLRSKLMASQKNIDRALQIEAKHRGNLDKETSIYSDFKGIEGLRNADETSPQDNGKQPLPEGINLEPGIHADGQGNKIEVFADGTYKEL